MPNPRYRFVEQQLAAVETTLATPAVRQALGETLLSGLNDVLGHLTIANTRGGVITIPDDDGDTIPVVALSTGDNFLLGPEFTTPTNRQRASRIRTFTEWAPGLGDAVIMDREFTIRGQGQSFTQRVTMPGQTGARTMAPAMMLDFEEMARDCQLGFPPSALIAKFLMRPLVVLRMGSAAPDVTSHELTHVTQKIVRPVRLYSSQQDVQMDALADELPAYGGGAEVRRSMNGGTSAGPDPYRQIEADTLRTRHNRGTSDPFAASPELLDRYTRRGMPILHEHFDFDMALAAIQAARQPR